MNCDVKKDSVQTNKYLKTSDSIYISQKMSSQETFFQKEKLMLLHFLNAETFFSILSLGIPRNPVDVYEYVVTRHSLVKVF